MLDPEYLEKFSDQLLAIIDVLTISIVTDMSRRIAKMGRISDTTKHQAHIIQNAGIVYQDAIKRVSQVSGYTNREVERMFYEAGIKNLKNESVIYKRAGKDTVTLTQSYGMQKILNSNISKTKGQLSNLTMTTANKAQFSFIEACNKASMKVQTGAFSYDKAIADAIKEVAQQGTEVLYPSGHVDKLDVGTRRAVLTGVNQTSAQMNLQYAEEMDCDYVETTAHSGARPDHAIWQGKVFCISGKDAKYPNFYESTGYGTGPGLCGWNCRHNFYAFFPGISTPAYTKEMLEDYNAKKYEYNGKKHTEYEVSQMQRAQERRIRHTKRELSGFDSAIKATDDDVLKQTLQKEFELSSVKLKQQESALKDFCRQTGRRVESARTQIHAVLDKQGNIIGFNRSVAQRAVQANKRQIHNKYKGYFGTKNATETIDYLNKIKYNGEKCLLDGFIKGVDSGEISALTGFDAYRKIAHEIDSKLIGLKTEDGVTLKSYATHFVNRVVGQSSHPHPGKRMGVPVDVVKDALIHPIEIRKPREMKNGDVRVEYIGQKCRVIISIRDFILIQTNPRS
ncbi:MAG: phage minor capsid protein [Lachnospiraceae bacterium]|nr:phage minor capsid protein [Lachnospiraceae bacterium]